MLNILAYHDFVPLDSEMGIVLYIIEKTDYV